MNTTTDTARAVLTDLEAKLADARARHDEVQSEAKEIAFAAFTDGGDARKKLDKLHADAAKHGAEITALESALVEARRRVAEALAAETDAAQLAKAKEALALLDDFTNRGAELDAALAAFLDQYAKLTSDFTKLSALGYAPSTVALVRVNMGLAVATKLLDTDLRQRPLAPHERRSFVETIQGWAASARMRAAARLNAKPAAKAA
jgi:hypothetical protein